MAMRESEADAGQPRCGVAGCGTGPTGGVTNARGLRGSVQHLADLLRQGGYGERLLEKIHLVVQNAVTDDGIVG